MKKIIVLAGNHSQFMEYVSERLGDGNEYVEGCDAHHMNGIEAQEVIEIGTFFRDRKDYDEAKRLAYSRVR